MLARHGVSLGELKRFVAGADAFARQSDGTTFADQYRKLRIARRPARMDRQNGWAEVLGLPGDIEAGCPKKERVRHAQTRYSCSPRPRGSLGNVIGGTECGGHRNTLVTATVVVCPHSLQ